MARPRRRPQEKTETQVMTSQADNNVKTEKWAKAVFNYVECPDSGATFSCAPNGIREDFVDGKTYERPLAFFEMLNQNCRQVKRAMKKVNPNVLGSYEKTKSFKNRIKFDIQETWDKDIFIEE